MPSSPPLAVETKLEERLSLRSLVIALGAVMIAAVLQVRLGILLLDDESAVFTVAVLISLWLAGSRAGVAATCLAVVVQMHVLSRPLSIQAYGIHEAVGVGIWTAESLVMCLLFRALDRSKRRALLSTMEIERKNRLLAESDEHLKCLQQGLETATPVQMAEPAQPRESSKGAAVADGTERAVGVSKGLSLRSLGFAVAAVIVAAALQRGTGALLSDDESAVFTVALVATLWFAGSRAGLVMMCLSILVQIRFFSWPFSFHAVSAHEAIGVGIWTAESILACFLFGALNASQGRAVVSAREIERNNRELTKANDLLKEEVATRTRVDRAVRESEETHRALFKESPNAKIAFDVNTLRIVAANDAALHLYGYSSEEFLAMSLRDICESDYAVPNDPMVTPPHERTGTVEHRTRTGRKFTAQLSSALVNLRGQRVRITCVTDVTERQQLEAQLHHSQKMEAVGRLAGGIAHDFNNMLSIMLGYAILVLDEMPTTDPAYPALVEIKRAAERSADLTKQLLAFSRQQSRSVEVLDVNDVVRGTEKLVRRLVGENIEIVTHLEPKGCRALVDAGQLEQIIMNLVVNARDALPKGGRLTIETTFAELDELYVAKHEGVAPGRYVLLAVSDDGVGMDQATQARIFEPFFTTKEQGRGTGLGLAMVFGIVQQAGGLVWVYSEPGRGATFKVYLPATDQAVPEATAEMHARGGSGTETILLVEDEDQVRALVERVLRGRGYRVLTAASPSVALEVAGKYPAHIDLLLTDVMMPQMNGRELSDKLFTTRPSIRVLYMSGYTDNVVLDHGVPGDLAFLQKPITPNVLSRKLRELLDSSEKAN